MLAAPEPLRSAHHEEISAAIRLKMAMAEVRKLFHQPPCWIMRLTMITKDQHLQPKQGGERIEMEAENELVVTPRPLPPAWERAESREEQIKTSVRKLLLLDDVPVAMKRARKDHTNAVFMTKRYIPEKGREKQLEKELPWGLIPFKKRHLYQEAELKQWKELLEFGGAVKALSVEESEEVIKNVPKERILNFRFAYKDKNHAARNVG